jgi:hypothetical protein
MPLLPEGVKTAEMDQQVTRLWAEIHLRIGIEAMTEVGEQGRARGHARRPGGISADAAEAGSHAHPGQRNPIRLNGWCPPPFVELLNTLPHKTLTLRTSPLDNAPFNLL